jgi:hypothetical protein
MRRGLFCIGAFGLPADRTAVIVNGDAYINNTWVLLQALEGYGCL